MRSHIMLIVATVIVAGTTPSALAQADLSLTFSGAPQGGSGGTMPLAPGGQAYYFLKVANAGPNAATNVVVTVTFPPKTSISNAGPPGPTCTTSVVGSNPTLTCTETSLANGASFTKVITLDLASDYPWQNGLSATASVTSSTGDPNPSNNTLTVNLAVQAPITIPALDGRSLMLLMAMLAIVGLVVMSRASA